MKLGWEQEWIDIAKHIVREQYKSSYADYVIHKAPRSACAPKTTVSPFCSPIRVLIILSH
jgi:hypothetical protein